MMVFMLIFVGNFKPSLDSHAFDVLNECFLLTQANMLAIYTEFVPEPDTRYEMGWVSAGLLSF